jgi:DNA-directed RNA polymerase specialized sigma24 family protein
MTEQEMIPAQLSLEPIYAAIDADLRRLIARRVDDGAVVEDILQDTYLRIHTHLPNLRDTARLHGWVFQIARNAVADFYRGRPSTTPRGWWCSNLSQQWHNCATCSRQGSQPRWRRKTSSTG